MTATHSAGTHPSGPIGVFDSGFGGLTVLQALRRRLPEYRYIYLGDNARAPYGTRSFDLIYNFTLEAVNELFARGCPLVILACNTASAKALRTIQQHDLPLSSDPTRRVLGVIRPTAEHVGLVSRTRHIGIFATPGTVASGSYGMEIAKLYPDCTSTAHGCPMWVPLIENGHAATPGSDWFVNNDCRALMDSDPLIDTVILGCTHYPLLMDKIKAALPRGVTVVPQGDIVAHSLAQYLERHPEMERRLARGGTVQYITTENPAAFERLAAVILNQPVRAAHVTLKGL